MEELDGSKRQQVPTKWYLSTTLHIISQQTNFNTHCKEDFKTHQEKMLYFGFHN
jgi:hypothetical protein